MAGLSSVAVISAHGGHRFRPPPKSGHFQTETGGFFAPNWVATLDRNEWPLCSEIRSTFAAQFFTPGFFEQNYVRTPTSISAKLDDGTLLPLFESFVEDFEGHENALDMIILDPEDRTRFYSSFTLQSPSAKTVSEYVDLRQCILDGSCDFIDNRFDLVADPEAPDNTVLKLFSVAPTSDMVTAKTSISSTLVAFEKGDDFWFEGRFFIEGELPTTIADFESSHFVSGPGPRLIFKGSHLAVENKFGSELTYRQQAGGEVNFPTNEWVTVKVHLLYDEENGKIEVWQDGVLIIDATGQNIPVDFWLQDGIEVGISATSSETSMYLDDLRFGREAF